MGPKDMDITSLSDALIEYRGDTATIDLFTPTLAFDGKYELGKYVVTELVEGRVDLLIEDIYGADNYVYADIDVILYINNIDNPLSIVKDMTILYPRKDNLVNFRWTPNNDQTDVAATDRVTKKLMYPNKTKSNDPNRSKHLSSAAVPPTVNTNSRPPVVVGDGKIIIGGI